MSSGVEMVPQPHGGSIQRGFTPEQAAAGGRARARKVRERQARSEALEEAILVGAEKFSAVFTRLIHEAQGRQPRCRRCGAFGRKAPQLRPRDVALLIGQLMEILHRLPEHTEGAPFVVEVMGPEP